MTSTEIKLEIARTETRLQEVREMAFTSQEDLHKRQSGFIAGKVKVEDVQAVQGRRDTLESSISSLELRLAEMRSNLADAEHIESFETACGRMESLAAGASADFDAFAAKRLEIERYLDAVIPGLYEIRAAISAKSNGFRSEYHGITADFTKGEVDDELHRRGIAHDKRLRMLSGDVPKITDAGLLAGGVDAAFGAFANARAKEGLAALRASADEQRIRQSRERATAQSA